MRLETTAPRPADLRLLPPALAAWLTAGTLIGFAPDAPLGTVALVLWAAAVLSVLMATRSRSLAVVSIALTTAALVATVVAAQAPGRVPPAFADASGGPDVELDVTTTGTLHDGRLPGSAVLTDAPGAGAASVLLFLDEAVPAQLGETWRMRARMIAAEPGDEIAFLAFVEGDATQLGRAPPALAAASALRAGLIAASERLPGDGARLLPGLAVGDTSRVDEPLDAAMKAASLTHLTAVSGANVAIRPVQGLV